MMSQSHSLSDSWNFGTEKESLIHRIHRYPAKFPGFITTKALQYAEKQGVQVNTVADVFCGCGTTAVEAKKNGKKFWGYDINPVAVLIAQVKARHYDDTVLKKHFSSITKKFSSIQINKHDIATINDRIQYWFNKKTIEDLLKLKEAITLEVPNRSPYQKFFLCAFSNILKPTSRWLAKSIKPQIDPDKLPSDVMEMFEKQFNFMQQANNENVFPEPNVSHRIMRKNFLSARTDKHKADLIVTSPPYVTSYDYADIHQLSALWLGFCLDYRNLRENMVGNIYGVKKPSPKTIKSLPGTGWQIYQELLSEHTSKANSTAKYFMDIRKTVEKCYGILNNNGMAVFVIGNTVHRGVNVDNATFLESCMETVGFQQIKKISRRISFKNLTPHRDSKGRFSARSGEKEVYAKEFVIIGRKS